MIENDEGEVQGHFHNGLGNMLVRCVRARTLFQVMASLAQMERALMMERTRAGLEGRPAPRTREGGENVR